MAEVLRFRSRFSSSPPRREIYCDPSDGSGGEDEEEGRGCSSREAVERKEERKSGGGEEEEGQLSVLALLLTVLRKSLLGCKAVAVVDEAMEISWPTDVQHVAHVTFDRFRGFLGLPVEFELEVPRRAPCASATIFGISAESMQCSYDSRGNSVPTILLLMQRRLYEQGGLWAEGIFRINGENDQEEYVRHQLNNGIVPEGIDVHCLAGLLKAWFRELPSGLLDSLSSDQIMQCRTEEDCARLATLLPPTEAALLNWSINLMADVAQQEHLNKMNAHNIATVFAPNMTQMADPLTALMHAVQVMNFLRMLILKTLKERQGSSFDDVFVFSADPSDENGCGSPPYNLKICNHQGSHHVHVIKHQQPLLLNPFRVAREKSSSYENSASKENALTLTGSSNAQELSTNCRNFPVHSNSPRKKGRRLSSPNHRKGRRTKGAKASMQDEKSQETSNLSRINSKAECVEAI
ncbi:rho GTPase-activating protein 5-like [Zingiber officinale]|uniref:Uncharacterized protein n=1 Tax=Zingiber officinale TaxID=94328 RepID=A0A8J5FC66_ZINOF|nr:rho GTPase-activating protein 5-like [Zingiber officinale]KAG6483443.1 hypothetical protein ZIOFF_060090 [Zingiber officinale]